MAPASVTRLRPARRTLRRRLVGLDQAVLSLDSAEVLPAIVRTAVDLFDASFAAFWTADEARRTLVGAAGSDEGMWADCPLQTVSFDHGLIGEVARTRRAVDVASVFDDERILAPEWFRRHGLRSCYGIPLVIGESVLGVLAVAGESPFQLRRADLKRLASFTDQASLAIRNARLFAASERRRLAAESLAEVGRLLTQSLDVHVVARRILDSVGRLLRAHSPSLYQLDRATGALVAVAVSRGIAGTIGEGFVFHAGSGMGGLAVRCRETVTSPNFLDDPRVVLTPALRHRLDGAPYRALLSVPLIVKDEVIGVLSVGDREGRVFDKVDIHIAQAFADQAALALTNAGLFEETERRRKTAEALAEVGRLVSQSLDLAEVAERIAESVRTLLGVSNSALFEARLGTQELVSLCLKGDHGPGDRPIVYRIGHGAVGVAAKERHPIVTADLVDDPRIPQPPEHRARMEQAPFRAVLALPLLLQDRLVGVLVLGDRAGRVFSEEEVGIAQAFAAQATVAMENARLYTQATELYEQAKVRAARMTRLNQLGQLVGSSLDTQHVLDFVASAAGELLHGEVAHLWVIDEATGALRLAADTDGPRSAATPKIDTLGPGQGVAGSVVERKEKYYVANLAEDPHFANKAWARAGSYVSMIAVPLVAGEAAVGVLAIITRSPRTFTVEEEELLELLAGKAAIALVNARLYEATQRALGELKAKNAELDSFVYSVSHDLKAPLVTIQGMASMLLADCASSLDERGQHYLQRIEANIGQMERLISDLLALSRVGREARPAELVSLAEIADDVLASLAEPIRAGGVNVVRHQLGSVSGVRTQLEQVFANLIGNAVKYLGDSPDPQVEIGAVERDGWVECYVRDNGIGIDPAYHAQVFELFQRLKEVSAEGSGVGLAIVKKIVEAAGGRVWVESAKGHGTTFLFTWPTTTSQGDDRIAAQAMEAGAIDYVVKTAGYFPALPAVLKKVLEQHELALENARLLAESEAQRARLAQILDSTSDGFLLLDEAARVLAANRRAGDLLGFVPDEALGRELAQLLADHREATPGSGQLKALLGHIAGGGQGDLALAVPRRTLNWSGQPTRDTAGTTLGLTLTLRDVTQEREVDRLKSDFVSFVTHQLRTPLSGIKWMLELARQQPDAPPIADYVDEAASAAERLIKMVNDLIEITRLESGEVTPRGTIADLWELTSSLRDEFKAAIAEKDLRFTTNGAPDVPCVAADPALLHQAILNLISNAVKYTPVGGTIEVLIAREGEEVRWEIRDSGIGIPRACQARLFQKFYRADNVYAVETEGTGLGLYLVRLIAEHCRGRVDCQSEEGAGSVFAITLPRETSP